MKIVQRLPEEGREIGQIFCPWTLASDEYFVKVVLTEYETMQVKEIPFGIRNLPNFVLRKT